MSTNNETRKEHLTELAAYARGHGTRAMFRWLRDELIGANDAEADSPELRWEMTPVIVLCTDEERESI